MNILGFSQKKVIPQKGVVIFKQRNIINNEAEYNKSFEEIVDNLLDGFSKILDIPKDSISKKENNEKILKESANVSDTISSIKYLSINNNVIKIYTKLSKEKEPNATKVFNLNTGIFHYDYSLMKSNEEYAISDNIKFEKIDIISYEEFPDDRKIISGYNCFKVKMSYKDKVDEDEKEIADLFGEIIKYREMYVTDEIKFMFHPVVNHKEVLEKYYPLYINEIVSIMKGQNIEYTIKEISLN